MQKYQSHKVVEAAKINSVTMHDDGTATLNLLGDDGAACVATAEWLAKNTPNDGPLAGGYFVRYDDGYTSWSPSAAFESGYTPFTYDPADGALPVAGYLPQTQDAVDLVNSFKVDEETILRKLDTLAAAGPNDLQPDQRWLAIGRTSLETAFMAINRSVFKPGRVVLPGDAFTQGGKT
jgi:hypothetical protein